MSLEKVKIQIPGVSLEVKKRAEEFARSKGFGSVQDILRVFIYQLGEKKLNASFLPRVEFPVEKLPDEMEEEILRIEREDEFSDPLSASDFIEELKTW